jgi:hypothetical protein
VIATTTAHIREADGRLYITFAGPEKYALGAALRAAFPGHSTLYRTRAGAYRLWARDRERLEHWISGYGLSEQVYWEGRMGDTGCSGLS